MSEIEKTYMKLDLVNNKLADLDKLYNRELIYSVNLIVGIGLLILYGYNKT